MAIKNTPKIVDLYCGCGGFGLGAELAGFHTVAAIDVDATLQSAYKLNFPNTQVINSDLSNFGKKEWNRILENIKIDGVIGGPPCQGYSRMGAADPSDPRRELLIDYFRHVNLLSPRFFVMENVEGLMDKRNVQQLHRALNILDKKYTVLDPVVIDASQWGAPTRRKRVIVIGFDAKRISPITLADLLPPQSYVTVGDAIKDIREPIEQSKDPLDFGWAPYKKTNNISNYAKSMRSYPPKGLGSTEAIRQLKKGRVSGNFNTIHSEHVKNRYQQLRQGETDTISRSKKLAWDGFCPTLRAGTGADKGSHQAVRPIHPAKGRVITVREAARLQGFPDWFCFHPTKWHSFRMIGNSVSPIVSKAILSKLYQLCTLDEVRLIA
ncbi:MAG: DNA (cytosine-5)-methyltransferase 1 [Gammaproteobacteria bacterium]|jgi:DNA (cytosine-5)-methyltransferase 1